MPGLEVSFDEASARPPLLLVESTEPGVTVAVHDASRLGWQVPVPMPETGRAPYSFSLELEVPTHLVGPVDPWAGLQTYARLDGAGDGEPAGALSTGAFRRAVAAASSRLARARDGFLRHCTLLRSSNTLDDAHWQPLNLWLEVASVELSNTRAGLLASARENADKANEAERELADEFLSLQLWAVLTDCGRELFDTRAALEARGLTCAPFDPLENRLASALREEIAYRHHAGFTLAEPANIAQLERLLGRMRWLKRHFERVLFLDVESYQVVDRLSGWFSAVTAMIAYLWFLLWQVTLERHPIAIGSGVVAFAAITAVAYASRERLKEIGRSWLAGRIQRMFAQRITRCRLPSKGRTRPPCTLVSARESFSLSSAQRPDLEHPQLSLTRDVTVLRFAHRGVVFASAIPTSAARQIRFVYRLDLSPLFPRLHDAVRGFASLDRRTGRVSIVDVPRNYQIPLTAIFRHTGDGPIETKATLLLNKNGLLRIDANEARISPPVSPKEALAAGARGAR